MFDRAAVRPIVAENGLARFRAWLSQAAEVLRQVSRGYLMNPPGC
jgi:hypothetical protein